MTLANLQTSIAGWFRHERLAFSKSSTLQKLNNVRDDTAIELSNIRKSYVLGPVESEILKGVNLKIRRGDLVAIMGSSGCGKSTMMYIMGLMDRPSHGSCKIDGREVSELSDDQQSEFRNLSIGFVFQSSFLLPRLMAWENVAMPLAYRGISPVNAKSQAVDMLGRVGMGDYVNHNPNQMSGGQQQRVAIARAFVGEPSIVLADEPTGALDEETAQEIMDLIVGLNESDGMTAVIVTHDRDVAAQCGRVIRLNAGLAEERHPTSSSAAATGNH